MLPHEVRRGRTTQAIKENELASEGKRPLRSVDRHLHVARHLKGQCLRRNLHCVVPKTDTHFTERRMEKPFRIRSKAVLPVRISGVDTAGREFSVFGHTLDFHASGARLGKIQPNVKCGDELTIQYRSNKVRFVVRWIGPAESAVHGQLGIECLEAGKDLWPLQTEQKSAGVDDYRSSEPLSGSSSDREPRYACNGIVEVRASRAQKGFSARISDISSEGCRVLFSAALPIGTTVSLLLRIEGSEIEATGVVRTAFAGKGMGISFTHFASPADKDRLKLLISRLQSVHVTSVMGSRTTNSSASD